MSRPSRHAARIEEDPVHVLTVWSGPAPASEPAEYLTEGLERGGSAVVSPAARLEGDDNIGGQTSALTPALVRGGLAGLLATAPMSVAMAIWHRWLPYHERGPLPPREITMEVARRAGVRSRLDEPQKRAATLVSHFSYGSAMGALYGALSSRTVRPGVATGALFGLGVWAGSYLGLLPALGILPPATRHPPRRNALMIAAHLVWGAAAGGISRALDIDEEQSA
jgi:hypothetical protein